ncbi:MAG TPA: hypothetical protein DIV86_05505, partial [Alphaproteobacteria bacterium]|nr:hypothetical protein [Alphaproteobacteria bacterium]
MKKIGIIATGLIGGSLALALKKKKQYEVLAYNRKPEVSEKALKLGAIDGFYENPSSLVQNSDIIVLCAPLASYSNIVTSIKDDLTDKKILTDVGSVKYSSICEIKNILGDKINCFVPAHPIAGSEKGRFDNSKYDLFKGKNLLITTSDIFEIPKNNLREVRNLWGSVEAKVSVIDATLHDKIYAKISHFPQFLCFELGGFFPIHERVYMPEFSRLMNSNKEIWAEIFSYNSTNIKTCLKDFLDSYYANIKNYSTTGSGEINFEQIAHIITETYLQTIRSE